MTLSTGTLFSSAHAFFSQNAKQSNQFSGTETKKNTKLKWFVQTRDENSPDKNARQLMSNNIHFSPFHIEDRFASQAHRFARNQYRNRGFVLLTVHAHNERLENERNTDRIFPQ